MNRHQRRASSAALRIAPPPTPQNQPLDISVGSSVAAGDAPPYVLLGFGQGSTSLLSTTLPPENARVLAHAILDAADRAEGKAVPTDAAEMAAGTLVVDAPGPL